MSAGTAKGGRRDLTQGPIGRTLVLFALPTLGANVLQSLNASINMVWIGRFLGERALAATSNATLILFLLLGGVFGFGMAATILIGQHMGRRDLEGVRRAIGAAASLFIVMSLIVTVGGYAFSDWLLHILATPPEALPLARIYLPIIFLGMPSMFLLTLMMMGLRGIGDSVTPLIFMILGAVLDAGFNPLLIAGIGPFPKMGIAGSAVATLISNYSVTIGLLIYIYVKDIPIRLRGSEFRYLFPRFALLRLILTKGFAMGLQVIVITASAIVMMGLVNRAGVITAAAYSVAIQLWNYVQMPAMAVGAAVSAMAAQNIGAGRWDRVAAITRQGILLNLLLTGALIALLMIFDREVLGLFLGAHSPSIPIASHIQYVAGWNFLLAGMMLVMFGTVRANGAVIIPLIAMAVALLPGRVGFALIAQRWLGIEALWWSFPVGSAFATAFAALYYHYGDWRGPALVGAAELAEHPELAEPSLAV